MIKRYDLTNAGYELADEAEHETGYWVKYEDIQSILMSYGLATEIAVKKIKELESLQTNQFSCTACETIHEIEFKGDPSYIQIEAVKNDK